jgi:hypothetical protein
MKKLILPYGNMAIEKRFLENKPSRHFSPVRFERGIKK